MTAHQRTRPNPPSLRTNPPRREKEWAVTSVADFTATRPLNKPEKEKERIK